MLKQRIEIERELKSKSPNIIWKLMSTPEGLARWIADDIRISGDRLTFIWGNAWSHHETRHATITALEKNRRLRFEWEDDNDSETNYVDMKLIKNELTDDFLLRITDFADKDDVEWLQDVWNRNMENLHRTSGL